MKETIMFTRKVREALPYMDAPALRELVEDMLLMLQEDASVRASTIRILEDS